jgi:hypothetical protein
MPGEQLQVLGERFNTNLRRKKKGELQNSRILKPLTLKSLRSRVNAYTTYQEGSRELQDRSYKDGLSKGQRARAYGCSHSICDIIGACIGCGPVLHWILSLRAKHVNSSGISKKQGAFYTLC